MRPTRWMSLAAAAAGTALLAACASGGSTPAASSGGTSAASPLAGQTITLYNGQHEQTTDALVKAFEQKTGVAVKVRSDDEDVLAQQVEQEGSHSPADVFFTENTPPLAALDEKGLLAPVESQALAQVPAKYGAT
jgi:iron(III) transport system substrate-binding protein